MIVCPGCGARNEPSARVCEWCARPFVVERHQLVVPWLAPASIGAIVLLATGTIIAAIVGARVTSGRDTPPEPTGISVEAPDEAATSEPAAVFTATAAASPEADEFVRIANTGGSGAFLRREPRPAAAGVVAHRDGTILRVVGPNATVDGRVWREVEDAQGNRGWTPREFVVPSERGF